MSIATRPSDTLSTATLAGWVLPDALALVSDGLTVPLADGRTATYANFDHAASTPALVRVADAVERAGRTYASCHRGTGWTSRITTGLLEAARAEVARFLGAGPDDQVIFTRNTTDSFNLLARAIPVDTTVLVFRSEHHATLLPWRAPHLLPIPTSARDAVTILREGLAATADAPNRLVVLTGASNVTGEYLPVAELAALARAAGARTVLDAAQLAPHRGIDLSALGVDWVAFSGHKVHAPYGAGVLAGRRDWLDAAEPYLAGGGASAAVDATGTRWHGGPARHEAGTPNVLGAIALAAACATLAAHRDTLLAHEEALAARLVDGLRVIPGVRLHSFLGEDTDRAPVATFTLDGLDSALVAEVLSAEHGIGVRQGKFCAHQLVDHLLHGAPQTAAVRASAGLGTTLAEVERLLTAVGELAASGPHLDYLRGADGAWRPVTDLRDDALDLPW